IRTVLGFGRQFGKFHRNNLLDLGERSIALHRFPALERVALSTGEPHRLYSPGAAHGIPLCISDLRIGSRTATGRPVTLAGLSERRAPGSACVLERSTPPRFRSPPEVAACIQGCTTETSGAALARLERGGAELDRQLRSFSRRQLYHVGSHVAGLDTNHPFVL